MAWAALLASCVTIDTPPDPTTDDAIVDANVKFTLEYFKASYDERNNYVASPYHVRLALSMFYPLAGAAVQEDFRIAFGLPDDTDTTVEQQIRLARRMNETDGRCLKALSFVLVEQSLQLDANFERLFMHTYDTTLEPVDLTDDIPSAAAVNSFYRMANTEIDDFICEGDVFSLDPCFKLMLFSGVSVLSPLSVRFRATETTLGCFRFVNAPEKRVPIMRTTATIRRCLHNELRCAVVDIPFDEPSGLSLLLLLPNEGTELRQVVSTLTSKHLEQIDEYLQPTLTELRLPVFFVREKTDTKTILGKLGYGGVFEIADLRIFRDQPRTCLSGFFQHCYLAIGDGAEGGIPAEEPAAEPTHKFHADRPFMFAVRRMADRNILQIGHYSRYIDPDEQF
ncbi:serpin B5-like [Anopheles nili]|uniref:serpin B5-like n=1 Tax=Anopheles nili TaxID=185578 RepID=UPI00237AD3CE|nr:serpin B5-like [Anopheles nili]